MDDARDLERSLRGTPEKTASASDAEARILTFAELQELIETGKVDQIPNNKVIPEALNVSIFLYIKIH